MPRRHDRDISFDPPPDWMDRSMVAYAAPTDDPTKEGAPNFVMTREPMRDTDTLRSHADRQLIELGRQLRDFDLLESKETTLGGGPAVHLRYTWMSHFGRLEQSVIVTERPADKGRMAVAFTTTSRTEEAAKMKSVFADMLRSVRFDGPQPPPGGSIPPPTSSGRPLDNVTPFVPMPGHRERDRR
jgi:hypothetical protein